MSLFDALTWNLAQAEVELAQFKAWLSTQTYVGETAIVAQLKMRQQMCALFAPACGVALPDLIKFELTLKGLFRTDLVLGNSATRQFALIEFEDANEDSVFRKTKNKYQYRPWAARLEHGFGQVLDWAWLKSDAPNDPVLTSAFGGAIVDSAYLVVAGRDSCLADDMEKRRFTHRAGVVKISGVPARVMTYDGMVRLLETTLKVFKV